MPTTKTQTLTTVEFSPEEAAALLKAHLPALDTEGVLFGAGRITFQLQHAALAETLKTAIPDLPAAFSVAQVQSNPKVALRVSWLSTPTT